MQTVKIQEKGACAFHIFAHVHFSCCAWQVQSVCAWYCVSWHIADDRTHLTVKYVCCLSISTKSGQMAMTAATFVDAINHKKNRTKKNWSFNAIDGFSLSLRSTAVLAAADQSIRMKSITFDYYIHILPFSFFSSSISAVFGRSSCCFAFVTFRFLF